MIDTVGGRLAVAHDDITRVLPADQLSALPAGEEWARGILGFAPWPDNITVDVSIVGGARQYRVRRKTVARGAQKASLAMHEAGSAWTQKIPANPALAASFNGGVAQGAMAQALDYWRYCINKTGNLGIAAAGRRWSVPVYFCDESTPTQNITGMMFGTADQDRFNGLPVPAGAAPDPAGDGHYCAIKIHTTDGTEHGEEFNGYNLLVNAGVFSVDGSGWCVCDPPRRGFIRGADGVGGGLGIRANQTSGLAGLIWPHEIAMGHIPHALAFSHPKQRAYFYPQSAASTIKSPANGCVTTPVNPPAGYDTRAGYPGTLTYEITNDPEGLPGGQRVQLDPSIDIDQAAIDFAWPDYQKVIAKAAQEYGMIMVDGGGYSVERIGLYLVNTQGWATNPFTPIHADLAGDSTPLMRWANDLRESFRILDMGTAEPRSFHAYSIPNDGHNATAYTA